MAANSVSDAVRALRQKFNITDEANPSSISMDDILSSVAYMESFPKTFKIDFRAPKNLLVTDIYRIVNTFVTNHSQNTELQQILFPLFCAVVVELKRLKSPDDVTSKFIADNIGTIPEHDRPSALEFTTNAATFQRLASLLSTQRAILRFTSPTKSLVLKFLNEQTNSKVRAMFMDVFEIWDVREEVPYEAIIDRFTGSLTRGISILKARVTGATHARFSRTTPELFTVIDGHKVVRTCFTTMQSHDICIHSETVTTIGLSSQSRVLLTADFGANVNLWSHAGSVRFNTGMYPIWCSDFAPQGGVFALGYGDGFAKLCCTDTQKQFRAFSTGVTPVVGVKFHPNCAYVATVADTSVRLWDVRKAENVRLFFMEKAGCSELAFSPNGEYLAGFDGGLSVFHIGKNEMVVRKPSNIKNLAGLGFAENSKTVFLVGDDGIIEAVDIGHDGEPVRTICAMNEAVVSVDSYLNELRIVTSY